MQTIINHENATEAFSKRTRAVSRTAADSPVAEEEAAVFDLKRPDVLPAVEAAIGLSKSEILSRRSEFQTSQMSEFRIYEQRDVDDPLYYSDSLSPFN